METAMVEALKARIFEMVEIEAPIDPEALADEFDATRLFVELLLHEMAIEEGLI